MEQWLLLAVKVVLAGFFVAFLSHLSGATRPKMFSGLFAGAPVVAAISLGITAAVDPGKAASGGRGMIAGALGMVVCCAVAALLVPRLHAAWASAAGWAAWALTAAAAFVLVVS